MLSRFRNFAVRFSALALILIFCCVTARSQSATAGAVSGLVTDQQGKAIADAQVTVKNLGTNAATRPVKTDSNGRYIIPDLQPGKYEVTITAPNFATFTRNDLIVEVGLATPVDVTMGVAGQSVSVSVSAEAPVVNTERNDVATNINLNSVSNLPINGRRWSSYVLATPGTVADGSFGLISFRGISGLLNNSTIDGADNNQAFFAEEKGRTRIAYSTGLDAIQEFQVNTSNYSAEYGRAAGGVVNAVTKSGSNTLHGDAFFYDRDNSIGAAFNPFTRASLQTSPGVFTSVPIKPPDARYQYGADVGGDLIKNKLFWFFSYDGQNRNFPLTSIPTSPAVFFGGITVAAPPTPPAGTQQCTLAGGAVGPGGVPWNSGSTEGQQLFCRGISQAQSDATLGFLSSLTGVVPRTGNQNIFFPKLDWKITPNNTLTFSYNRLRWWSPEGVQTGATVANGIDSIGNDGVKADTAIAQWTAVISPTLTNMLRVNYSRDFEFESSDKPIAGEPVSAQGRSPNISIGGAASFSFGKPTFLERRSFPDERRWQAADTTSWVRGTHLFKVGFDISRVHDTLDSLNSEGGSYSYPSRVAFISDFVASQNHINGGLLCGTGTPSAPTAVPCYTNFTQGLGPTAFQFATWDHAIFAQDDWHATSRLTFNYGMRWELEVLPNPQIPNVSIPATGHFPSNKHNFGPRAGFAWDLSGHGTTVIRAGAGVYYGRIINSTISNAITNTGTTAGQLQLSILPTAAGAPVYPTILASGSPAVNKPDVVLFDPSLKDPMIYEYDAIFEKQVMTNTVVSVSYLGSTGHDLPAFIDRNLPAPSFENFKVIGGALDQQIFSMPVFLGARPFPLFGRFTTVVSDVVSHYNAMALQFNRRMTKGLQFQMSYTLAKSTDNGQSSQTFTASNNVVDPFDRSFDVGPSNLDVRHRYVASAVWTPMYFQDRGRAAHWILDGWTVSPIVSVQSGYPFSPSVSGNLPNGSGAISTGILGAGGTNRPTFIARNSARLPRTSQVDLRLSRGFKVHERVTAQVFVEAFNLFNHTNYTAATSTLYTAGGTVALPTLTLNSTFGALTNANNGTLGPTQRLLQLGARVSF